MIDVKRIDVESVKLALKSIMRSNISVVNTISSSVEFLKQCYGWSHNKNYLYSALVQIQAYLELGYKYEKNQELFDWILSELDTFKELQFTFEYYPVAIVAAEKKEIKKIIGNWNSTKYKTKPYDEILDEIVYFVKNKKKGRYVYSDNTRVHGRKIELMVGDNECYFHDVEKDRYYILTRIEEMC